MDYNFENYKKEYFKTLYKMKKENFKWYVKKIYGWDEKSKLKYIRTL